MITDLQISCADSFHSGIPTIFLQVWQKLALLGEKTTEKGQKW